MCRNSFQPTGESHSFFGGSFDANTVDRNANHIGNIFSHFINVGSKFRLLREDGSVDINNAVSVLLYDFGRPFEQKHTVGIFILLVGVGKMLSNIAQSSRAKKRVGNSVSEDVSVGMTCQSHFEFDFFSADYEWSSIFKAVSIVAVTDTKHNLIPLVTLLYHYTPFVSHKQLCKMLQKNLKFLHTKRLIISIFMLKYI